MTTLTTVNVTISLRRVINQPLPGGRAEFTLTRQDYDGAIAVPVTTESIGLPADGSDVVLALWPNVRGTQGSQYQVSIKDQAGVVQASGLATIPATDCSLAAVLYTSAPPQVPVYPAAQPTLGQVLVGGPRGTYTPTTLGTNKQLLFNDGGAPAGDAGLAYDKATGAITVGGKTVTASAAVLQATQTWNNAGVAFTGALINVTDTQSAAGSKLLDLQVAGISKWSADKAGNVSLAGSLTLGGDTIVLRGAANVLEQRNGANAQAFRVYNTFTDASNYERGFMRWAASVLEVGTDAAGTGLSRELRLRGEQIYFQTNNGTSRWYISQSGSLQPLADDNAYDLGRLAARVRTGFFGTSVSTPAVVFPATQVASADPNTLDDYEEGTFTPTVLFGGASSGLTYTTQDGTYTKVGRAVHFRLYIQISSKGTSTGGAQIGGLPFASNSSAGNKSALAMAAAQLTGLTGIMEAILPANTSLVAVYQLGSGSPVALTDANFAPGAEIFLSGTYFV